MQTPGKEASSWTFPSGPTMDRGPSLSEWLRQPQPVSAPPARPRPQHPLPGDGRRLAPGGPCVRHPAVGDLKQLPPGYVPAPCPLQRQSALCSQGCHAVGALGLLGGVEKKKEILPYRSVHSNGPYSRLPAHSTAFQGVKDNPSHPPPPPRGWLTLFSSTQPPAPPGPAPAPHWSLCLRVAPSAPASLTPSEPGRRTQSTGPRGTSHVGDHTRVSGYSAESPYPSGGQLLRGRIGLGRVFFPTVVLSRDSVAICCKCIDE